MKRQGLQKRFALVLILQTALILLLWFYYHIATLHSIQEATKENASIAAAKLIAEISGEFRQMQTVCGAISGSSYVQDLLTETDRKEYYEKAIAVAEIVDKAAYQSSPSDSIILFNSEGGFYRCSGGLSNLACGKLYETFQGAGAIYTTVELDDAIYFCHSSPVFASGENTSRHIGNVVMLTMLTKTRRLLTQDGSSDVDMFILSSNRVLLAGKPELEGKAVSQLEPLYQNIYFSTAENTGLQVAAAVSGNAEELESRRFLTMFSIMVGILLLTITLMYRYLSRGMVTPISSILKNADEIRDGTGRLAPTGVKNFDQLTLSINSMLDRNERYHMGLLGRQINVHFIVNTLICIESLSKQGEQEKVAKATKELTKLLKHMQNGSPDVNIFIEMEFIESYISLMNIRHEGKFHVNYEVDDKLVECQMPTFLLQPIVENAITHGLEAKPLDCKLNITGMLDQGDVVLAITDNGVGMNTEQLESLTDKLSHAHEGDFVEISGHGVALCNIQRRIRHLYGKEFGLFLQSQADYGTTVTIRLPFLKDC